MGLVLRADRLVGHQAKGRELGLPPLGFHRGSARDVLERLIDDGDEFHVVARCGAEVKKPIDHS